MTRRPGLSPTPPKPSVNDGNGNAIHNELLLGLSQAESQGLFSKLELVRLKVHHLLHETGDTLKSLRPRLPSLERSLQKSAQVFTMEIAHVAASNRRHEVDERLARWLLMCADRVQSDELPLTQEFLGQMRGTRRSSVTVAA